MNVYLVYYHVVKNRVGLATTRKCIYDFNLFCHSFPLFYEVKMTFLAS